MRIQFQLPKNAVFFNDRYILDRMERAERKVLGRFGALTRRSARSSMRRRKNPSKPGRPPRVVTGLLKKFLFFSYDKLEQSVVVGPAKVSGFAAAGEALPALEYGTSELDARPFMDPAFQRQLDEQMPDMWKDAIH